jgi:hypothetical protein
VNDRPITITFSPPLPCATIQGDKTCGKLATVGQLYPVGSGYLMQPFCAECVAALARIYLPPQPPRSEDDRRNGDDKP